MTKLFVPGVQADLIVRSRIVQRLEEGLRRRLTLISAPAGFGKTTLVASWLQTLDGDRYSFAWLSLDERDNDVDRFLTYFIEAIHLANPGAGGAARKMLQSAAPAQPQLIAISLINDIGRCPVRLCSCLMTIT